MLMYDGYLLDQWDHTSLLACHIQHLTALVHNLLNKGRKVKPVTFEQVHPYRVTKTKGLTITTENFGVLKQLGAAVGRQP